MLWMKYVQRILQLQFQTDGLVVKFSLLNIGTINSHVLLLSNKELYLHTQQNSINEKNIKKLALDLTRIYIDQRKKTAEDHKESPRNNFGKINLNK